MAESALKLAEGEVEIITGLDDDDDTASQYQRDDDRLRYIVNRRVNTGTTINLCFREARGDILVFVGDDCLFETQGWDRILADAVKGKKYAAVWTECGTGCKPLHPVATRAWVEALGGKFMSEEPHHYWLDYWYKEVSLMTGMIVKLPSVMIRHLHWTDEGGGGETAHDGTYLKNEARGAEDKAIFDAGWWHRYLEASAITTAAYREIGPPRTIEDRDMLRRFSADGVIPVNYKYANHFKDGTVPMRLEDCIAKAYRREPQYYGRTDVWLWSLLEKYPIRGKRVLVVGSRHPWYEAICLIYGAREIVVSDFDPRPVEHASIRYATPRQIEGEKFDVAVSIGSYEHTGLGRYGDALHPDGDLMAMENVRGMAEALFLAVPMGRDRLVFNLHRVYGPVRREKLLKGWDVVDEAGYCEADSLRDWGGTEYQPVRYLRRKP